MEKEEYFEFALEQPIKDSEAYRKEKNGEIIIERIEIKDEKTAQKLGKDIGKYTSIHISKAPSTKYQSDMLKDTICEELKRLYNFNGKKVIIAGLGNEKAIVDKLGCMVVDELNNIDINENYFRLAKGVFSRVSTKEYLKAVQKATNADVIILIDALLCRNSIRLCRSLQMSDAGICNDKEKLNRKNIGVPVISIGVPTALTDAESREYFMKSDIDFDLEFLSKLIAGAISNLQK